MTQVTRLCDLGSETSQTGPKAIASRVSFEVMTVAAPTYVTDRPL